MAKNARFVELIRTIAARKGATKAQVALAWVLAHAEELADIRRRLPQETAGSRY